MRRMVLVWLVLVMWLLVGCNLTDGEKRSLSEQVIEGNPENSEVVVVSVVVEDDEGQVESVVDEQELEWKEGKSVFEALGDLGKEKGIELGWEEYDFGVLVTRIGEWENTKDLVWIFYVNGQVADVGAGEKKLNSGDLVEWKYQESIY